MLLVENISSKLLPTISLQASQGDCICIHGESGTGKTLLLRAIADLDENLGNISLDNQNRNHMAPEAWRKLVTYLPTDSYWWSSQVIDHFNPSSEDLASLALHQNIRNWDVLRLSSGEKQRLALLRTLTHQPKVLLLDEVTANLDVDNTQRVEQLLNEKLKQGLIIIWVTHDKEQRQRMATSSFQLTKSSLIQD